MEYGTVIGFISLGILIIINLLVVSFSYGRISQSVTDLNHRVERLEKLYDGIKRS